MLTTSSHRLMSAAPRGVRLKIPAPTSQRSSPPRLSRCALGLLILITLFVSWAAQAATNRTLTVSKSGDGTVSGDGINCGSTCSASYKSGTSVRLTAKPATGQTFSGWGEACSGTGSCTVRMSLNRSVSASFTGPAAGAAVPSVVFSSSATQYQRLTAQITWGTGTIPSPFTVQLQDAKSGQPTTNGRITTVVFTPQLAGSKTWTVITGTGTNTRVVSSGMITVAIAPPFVVTPNRPSQVAHPGPDNRGYCQPQCTEFVQAQLGLVGGRGYAKNFWPDPYIGYTNQRQGQSQRPPRPGDILVWGASLPTSLAICVAAGGCGHVGIVRSVDLASGTLTMVDTNWRGDCAQRDVNLTVTREGSGAYTVGGLSAEHLLGWQSKD